MTTMRQLRVWLVRFTGGLFGREDRERDFASELESHLQMHVEDSLRAGMTPEEARREALMKLGGVEQTKEIYRERRGLPWLDALWQDVRFGFRLLRKNPGFAAIAVLIMALGSGATTVMFSVVNGVLLKSLPYPDPSRLVYVHGHTSAWNATAMGRQNLSYLDFLDCKRENRSLALAGLVYNPATMSEPGEPEYVERREISHDLFSVLQVPLYRGRAFLPEEDQPGAAPVAILTYSFWQRRFAGNAAAMGASFVLDGKRYTIVGITPAGFRKDGEEGDVFTPMGQDTATFMKSHRAQPVLGIARLQPGTKLGEAQAEFALIGRELEKEFPDTNAGRSFTVEPLRPQVGNVGSTLWLLLGAVSLLLLIACANIASLLLARAVSRERELAMRVALGAGRGRLVRQCLTESAFLGLAGGLLGVFFASEGIRPFVAFWPGALPRAEEVHVDWRVLLFATAVSLVSGLLFGLAPALRAPTRDVERILRSGGRSAAGSSRRLHSSFVVSEVALAMVLLVAAGMLGRTLLYLSSLDPGMDTRNVLVTRMALSPSTLTSPAAIRAGWQEVLDRARRVPGVQSAATADTFPMRDGYNALGYWPSADLPSEEKLPFALVTSVSPEYLKVMGIPLRQGRFFDDRDRLDTVPVVVIDDVLAKNAFGSQDPVGKRLWIPHMGYGSGVFEVVGVVGHVRHWGLAGDDQSTLRAQLYYPFAQLPDGMLRRWSELMSIAVRTSVTPLSLLEPLRHTLRGVSGDQVLYEVHTMDELANNSLARQRFLLLLFGLFATLGLFLACIGIYGVLAYLTSRRVPEIGVRMALGATPGEVMWMVLRESLVTICAGLALGSAGALAAGRAMEHLVEGMQPNEASAFMITIPVLVAAALIASYVPARRAMRVDPMVALRYE